MGILVSVIVGIALTLPISTRSHLRGPGPDGSGRRRGRCRAAAPRWSALRCCPSGRTSWGGLVSQGLGTSMLQMGNIVRNPPHLDPRDLGLGHYRPHRDLHLPPGDERCSRLLRHGHLRPGRPDRGLHRLGGSDRPGHESRHHWHGLAGDGPHLLRVAGGAELARSAWAAASWDGSKRATSPWIPEPLGHLLAPENLYKENVVFLYKFDK